MKKNEGFHTEELGKRNRVLGGVNHAQIGAKLLENNKQPNLPGSFSFNETNSVIFLFLFFSSIIVTKVLRLLSYFKEEGL